MVASGVVDYDPRDGTYAFPCEHAAFLTRAATPANLAVFAQWILCWGVAKTTLSACFRLGGGVLYARFEHFHEVMAEDSGQTVLPVLKSHILPLVPGLDERLKDGIRILDVGCGRGRALNLLATWFPNSRFVGIDLSEEAIKFARVKADQRGNKNVSFIARDLSRFDHRPNQALLTSSPPSMPFTTKPAREISYAAFGSRWPTTESHWRRT